MDSVPRIILAIILVIEFIAGSFGNVFIVLVNYRDWVRRRQISSVDQILTALAISRITLLWSVLTYIMIIVLFPGLYMSSKMFQVTNIIWVVTNHFSVWIATSLSIFYFLKVAKFSSSIFLYLKWRVKKVIMLTTLVSLVPLFLNIVLSEMYVHSWFDGYVKDMFHHLNVTNLTQFPKVLLFANSMCMFIPFTVSLMAFLLLIVSLWKHYKKMRDPSRGGRDASTAAHVKAVQIGMAFLLLYAGYLLCLVMEISSFELLESNVIVLFDHSTGLSFPSGHSFVLILGNSKLRQASLSVLCKLRCRCKDADPSVPEVTQAQTLQFKSRHAQFWK